MQDDSGFFDIVWFQGIKYFKDRFNPGEFLAVAGKPAISRYGNLQFVHPDLDKLGNEESKDFKNTGKIIPFYRLPKELRSTNIGDFSIRKILNAAVEEYADALNETLPEHVIESQSLLSIVETVRAMHFPKSMEELERAVQRMKFEELFYIEILVAKRKHLIKEETDGFSFKVKPDTINSFISTLPFDLTNGQLAALKDIRRDMESSKPMNRLLQGDVGSGKTLVALIAALISADNGKQSAFMAPTEILAHQHFLNIQKLTTGLGISCDLLIGGQRKKEREEILKRIENGESGIVLGTHAIFEETVKFCDLGLVVIDEQHRFGVEQRARLIGKGARPDVLIMTATPIPRTLTMTVYGDLDVSLMRDMPKNRRPIRTVIRTNSALNGVYKYIVEQAQHGVQSYIVFPLVEESEKLQLKAAKEYFRKLTATHLKNVNVGLLHGKMHWRDKEEAMLKFARKEFDVLIATTVIEVGIDVPSANIIVIHDAFRFGLSQLHQLRGRVGRGAEQAYCILIGKDSHLAKNVSFNFEYLSRSQIENKKSAIRLKAMVKHGSGFKLSEIDLKLRGPGDLFGTKQSGLPAFKYAQLPEDSKTLETAKNLAFKLIDKDPKIAEAENTALKLNLELRYSENVKFAGVG